MSFVHLDIFGMEVERRRPWEWNDSTSLATWRQTTIQKSACRFKVCVDARFVKEVAKSWKTPTEDEEAHDEIAWGNIV